VNDAEQSTGTDWHVNLCPHKLFEQQLDNAQTASKSPMPLLEVTLWAGALTHRASNWDVARSNLGLDAKCVVQYFL
jgi:hypothetical protein